MSEATAMALGPAQANATQANISQANVTEANVTEANVTEANVTEANVTEANVTQANATQANATQENATQANGTQANATQANATQANATQANATQANATQANATQANATQANVTQANVALVPAVASGDKGRGEKRVRAENWTWEETVRLVEAKQREWEEKENGNLLRFTSTADKWVKVQKYMKESSLFRPRSVEQTRQKWEALYNSWKKIKISNSDGGGDYWMMSKQLKIDKRLPPSFDRRLWDMLSTFLGQKNVLSRNSKCFDSMCDHGTPSGMLIDDVSKPSLDPLGEDLNEANEATLSDENPAEKRGPFGEGDLPRGPMSGKRRKMRGPDAFVELVRESSKAIVEALGVQREDKQEELRLVLALEERKLQVEEIRLDMETRDRESVGRDRERMATALCSIKEALDKIVEKL